MNIAIIIFLLLEINSILCNEYPIYNTEPSFFSIVYPFISSSSFSSENGANIFGFSDFWIFKLSTFWESDLFSSLTTGQIITSISSLEVSSDFINEYLVSITQNIDEDGLRLKLFEYDGSSWICNGAFISGSYNSINSDFYTYAFTNMNIKISEDSDGSISIFTAPIADSDIEVILSVFTIDSNYLAFRSQEALATSFSSNSISPSYYLFVTTHCTRFCIYLLGTSTTPNKSKIMRYTLASLEATPVLDTSYSAEIPRLNQMNLKEVGDFIFYLGLSKFYIYSNDFSTQILEESSYSFSSEFNLLPKTSSFGVIAVSNSNIDKIYLYVYYIDGSNVYLVDTSNSISLSIASGFIILDDETDSDRSMLMIPNLPSELKRVLLCKHGEYFNSGACNSCPGGEFSIPGQTSCGTISSTCKLYMHNLGLCSNPSCVKPSPASWTSELDCEWSCDASLIPTHAEFDDLGLCTWICSSEYQLNSGSTGCEPIGTQDSTDNDEDTGAFITTTSDTTEEEEEDVDKDKNSNEDDDTTFTNVMIIIVVCSFLLGIASIFTLVCCCCRKNHIPRVVSHSNTSQTISDSQSTLNNSTFANSSSKHTIRKVSPNKLERGTIPNISLQRRVATAIMKKPKIPSLNKEFRAQTAIPKAIYKTSIDDGFLHDN